LIFYEIEEREAEKGKEAELAKQKQLVPSLRTRKMGYNGTNIHGPLMATIPISTTPNPTPMALLSHTISVKSVM
jgi:hypothetical protein